MDSKVNAYYPSMKISEGEIQIKGKTFGRWETKKFILDEEQKVFALKSLKAKKKYKPYFLPQYKVVNSEKKKDKVQFELVSKVGGKCLTLGMENEDQAKELIAHLLLLSAKTETIQKVETNLKKSELTVQTVVQPIVQPKQMALQQIDYEIPSFFDISEIRESIHQIRKNQFNMENFKKVYENKLQIYKSEVNHHNFKVFIEFAGDCSDVIAKNLTDKIKINQWNSFISQQESKLIRELHDDNAVAISEVRHLSNLFYFKREFQYLQHRFKIENTEFIVQKQLDQKPQTKNYCGSLRYGLYSISFSNNKTKFNYFTEQSMLGLNYPDEDSYFTQIFLQQLININTNQENIEQLVKQEQPSDLQYQIKPEAPEAIKQSIATQNDSDREQFFDCEEEDEMNDKLFIVQDSQHPRIQDDVVKDVYEQNARRMSTMPSQIDVFENISQWADKKMKSVLSGGYFSLAINIKHQLAPQERDLTQRQFLTSQEGGHYIFKKDFVREEKNGGLKVINEEKIAAQKAVIKFLLTRVGASLLMGKSVTGISMPVSIFEARSNTERVCNSMGFAPVYLEEAAQSSDIYERIKACSAFQFGFIFMYLSCEKPFNPILGETFQGFYDNCPIYCEQICHHPPICVIQMYGRSYKIDARLELVANFHTNSVVGRNIGTVKVIFENPPQEIHLTLAAGSLSGTAYGDRIMNYLEKQFIIDIKNKIIMEVSFNPDKKYCQQLEIEYVNQSDYLCGVMCDVTDAAIIRYQKEGYRKYKGLDLKNDIKQIKHRVKGTWTQEIKIDNQKLISIQSDYPIKMQLAQFPIASDANFRMDLLWWKLRKFDESQEWKEKLEILQRQDRKLRESKGKKKR